MKSGMRHWRERMLRGVAGSRSRFQALQQREFAIGVGGLLAGVTLAAIVVALARDGKPAGTNPATVTATTETQGAASADERAAERNSSPEPIKIVGAAANTATPCSEQTWPYIDRRCLTEAAPRQELPVAQPAVASVASASAAPAATADTPVPAAASDASARIEQPAPDAKPAETAKAETTATATADTDANEADKAPAQYQRKARTSRRHERERAAANEEHQGEHAVASEEQDSGSAPQRAARERRHTAARPVKRWRELVYDYPDGTRRRVVLSRSARGRFAETRSQSPAEDDD